jgi:inner membrane protein
MECIWSEGVVCKESIFHSVGFLWISAGFAMMILELIVPGIFIVFLGMSAVLTGLVLFIFDMRFLFQVLFWAFSSGVIIFAGGRFMEKIFPSDKKISENIEEPFTGKIVKVTQRITPEQPGRISYQGTEWTAKSIGSDLEVGQMVRIYDKENMTFIVNELSSEESQGA